MKRSPSALLDELQIQLLLKRPSLDELYHQSRRLTEDTSNSELALFSLCYRAVAVFRAHWGQSLEPNSVGLSDIVVLLRQLIRTFNRHLRLHQSLWDQIAPYAQNAELIAVPLQTPSVIEVHADDWCPDWLPHASDLDLLAQRRSDSPAVGDGMLSSISQGKWTTYQSFAQKVAVDAWLFARFGSTTIVILPTGAGKSLITVMPAWFESNKGNRSGGTTIVVVPTVALALDQEREARKLFPNARVRPSSFLGSTPDNEREVILRDLENGLLPLLFTSPEALLDSRLYDSCITAAARGHLSRLVIDEAHIIEAWGAGFRTDFQLLSGYRHRLLEESNGRLRTLLLSATVTRTSLGILEDSFGKPGPLTVIQANRLRPEPSYWFNEAPNHKVRVERVIDALFHLPRPAILYTTVRSHAENWRHLLIEAGFSRVGLFTGETSDHEREQMINAWIENRIDIMVATSAFGLGINKSDVRTIIHATLPETVDRYYQEVGRGGRDGLTSTSLVCLIHHDDKIAHSLLPLRITPAKAFARWQSMFQTSDSYEQRGDARLIYRDAIPAGRNINPGPRNREWNDHVLLMLQRAGLIEILDTRERQKIGQEWRRVLPIHIRDRNIIGSKDYFSDQIEAIRTQEKRDSRLHQRRMLRLVENYSKGRINHCIAREFAQIYPDTQLSCGGCPSCREVGRAPYTQAELLVHYHQSVTVQESLPEKWHLSSSMRRKLGNHNTLNVLWDGQRSLSTLLAFSHLFSKLVHEGFDQVILPQDLADHQEFRQHFVQKLSEFPTNQALQPHRIWTDQWLFELPNYPLLKRPALIVYPLKDQDADLLHQYLASHLNDDLPRINIIFHGLMLPSMSRQFTEVVDGNDIRIENLA